MSENQLAIVVTTIQKPTPCLLRLVEAAHGDGVRLLIIGDRKGPPSFHLHGVELYPLAEQQHLPFTLARKLPVGHYARKNLGYLLAAGGGAQCIYETDDDNMPTSDWQPRDLTTSARPILQTGWVNVYKAFSNELIWPRGFPLERVRAGGSAPQVASTAIQVSAPIQQGLADRMPDVDAVWRLVAGDEFYFSPAPSVWLPPGAWCPFNSQTTWWWPEAYPLLYLPSHCSFRMTDIWRSFVAQRCVWELGAGLVFHGPEVIQERNEHRLLNDFRDEVQGYLNNTEIAYCLENLRLKSGRNSACENLLYCYEALINSGILPAEEWELVSAWAADIEPLLDIRINTVRRAA